MTQTTWDFEDLEWKEMNIMASLMSSWLQSKGDSLAHLYRYHTSALYRNVTISRTVCHLVAMAGDVMTVEVEYKR